MKEMIMELITSHFFWIALEILAIALLTFFVINNSKRKKTIKEDMEQCLRASQYRELDEMLLNKKRETR